MGKQVDPERSEGDTGRQLRLMRIGETSNTGRGHSHSAFLMKMAKKENSYGTI